MPRCCGESRWANSPLISIDGPGRGWSSASRRKLSMRLLFFFCFHFFFISVARNASDRTPQIPPPPINRQPERRIAPGATHTAASCLRFWRTCPPFARTTLWLTWGATSIPILRMDWNPILWTQWKTLRPPPPPAARQIIPGCGESRVCQPPSDGLVWSNKNGSIFFLFSFFLSLFLLLLHALAAACTRALLQIPNNAESVRPARRE